jgi:hypothetical protein
VPQAADSVVARQAVGAICTQHEHRQLAERLGQRRQQLQRGLVRPLQVVEDHEHELVARESGKCTADRLEQRRPVCRGGRHAELGEDHRQVSDEPPAARQCVRVRAQVRAQRRRRRGVGRGAAVHGGARDHERIRRPANQLGDQPALTDPGLTAHEHEATVPSPGPIHPGHEPIKLGGASDEAAATRHGASLSTAREIRKYGDQADLRRGGRT